MIHAFKYHGDLALTRVLGSALVRAIDDSVDIIVPMPLSPGRLRSRGFNQALEIARVAGKATRTRVLPAACRRVLDTPSQAALPWKERAKNVRGAFVCDADLTGKRVAVVDDVMTTGATLGELAKKLKRAGASHVSGWIVARALPRSHGF